MKPTKQDQKSNRSDRQIPKFNLIQSVWLLYHVLQFQIFYLLDKTGLKLIHFDWLLHHILQFLIFYLVFLTVARQNWFKLVKLIQSVNASYFAISDFLFGIPHSC